MAFYNKNNIINDLRSIAKTLIYAFLIMTSTLSIAAFLFFVSDVEYQGVENKQICLNCNSDEKPDFRAFLIIHKILKDENSAEVSLVIHYSDKLIEEKKKSPDKCYNASVSILSYEPEFDPAHRFKIFCKLEPDIFAGEFNGEETPRFILPVEPSNTLYPYDELAFTPHVSLRNPEGVEMKLSTVVIKLFPGQIIQANGATIYESGEHASIVIKRGVIEKTLIAASCLTFIIINIAMTMKLFFSSTKITGTQEVVAVAGYIIAASSFRQLLSGSRLLDNSILDLFLFGIPMSILALGIGYSALRDARSGRRERE